MILLLNLKKSFAEFCHEHGEGVGRFTKTAVVYLEPVVNLRIFETSEDARDFIGCSGFGSIKISDCKLFLLKQ